MFVVRPASFHVWQITRPMKALEHTSNFPNKQAAFRRAGLVINPRIFSPVALVDSGKLNRMFVASNPAETPDMDEALDRRQMDPMPSDSHF
jgi:hypothetical protein